MARADFAKLCRTCLKQWKAARRRLLKSPTSRNAVHKWRICTRRLLALEALLAPPDPAQAGSLQEDLHAAFHAAGKLRDAQVTQRALRALSDRLPVANLVARHEARRLAPLARDLHRELRKRRPAHVARHIARWLRPARDAASDSLRMRAAQRMRARQRLLRPRSARETPRGLHQRRILLKQTRYMAELARAGGCALPRQSAPRELARMQSRLGAVTDIDVQLRALARYARKHPSRRVGVRNLQRKLRELREVAVTAL